ncbi:rubredoxin [Marinifilum caeruleilacunae]|nr:rubredoxin [Marinifilum caeruleilacunae]
MKKSNELSRVLIKGGTLSPALFYDIISFAENFGNQYIHLGSRQDILFSCPMNQNHEHRTEFSLQKKGSAVQNIVSSFVCVDILPSTSWLYSGIYLKVLEQFNDTHQLRINIVDPKQNMMPLFYGQLNFVASETANYWHLYLNLAADKNLQHWPGLIFTDDIAQFARQLEKVIIQKNLTCKELLVKEIEKIHLQKNTLTSDEKIILPEGFFPYYEGFNKVDGKDLYWIGLYWRNNQYPIPFLKELCELCRKTNVGKISFTPWKTLIIRDINSKDKMYWDELIGRYGLNMRHSSFELNWHLPLLDKLALQLKQYIVSKFDQLDIRTYGLSFSIQRKIDERLTTIVIRPKGRFPFLGSLDFTRSYTIEYAMDFNPNNNKYVSYAIKLSKKDLPASLYELSKKYSAFQFVHYNTQKLAKNERTESKAFTVYQCSNCHSVYDERYGDQLANIEAGTPFQLLQEDYCCQLCDSAKSDFVETEMWETV